EGCGARARAALRWTRRGAQGQPASHRRERGRVTYRTLARGRRAPSGRGLLHRAAAGAAPGAPARRGRRTVVVAVALSGVLIYPKPDGVTSHDVVASVRRRLAEEHGQRVKVGHAGTLDPFATGVLLVLVGAATRAQRFLMELPKTYRAVARLGWTSDTGDRDGRLENTGRIPESLEIPTGELQQVPPAFSAVKVGGQRLYEKE